ncbi:hypothetical protein ACS0TY_021318 [Phlomoides rotata]
MICAFFVLSESELPTKVVYIRKCYSLVSRVSGQIKYLRKVIEISNEDCINHLRMSRGAFSRLCYLLETSGGLQSTRNCTIAEQVAMFLSIPAHHTKKHIVKSNHIRSGHTVSKHFHRVLNSIIRLHSILLSQPRPIDENCTNERWKHFKGCLGALDGTYIDVHVPITEKGRYRNRKGQVSVNVLGVCDKNMRFVYVLTGWEGSATDSRVLQYTINRVNGLKVPIGNYYLCDNGYPNCDGFLTPYKGVRYHLNEWTSRHPQTHQEYFNMKHTRARNVIERSFGLLKMR